VHRERGADKNSNKKKNPVKMAETEEEGTCGVEEGVKDGQARLRGRAGRVS